MRTESTTTAPVLGRAAKTIKAIVIAALACVMVYYGMIFLGEVDPESHMTCGQVIWTKIYSAGIFTVCAMVVDILTSNNNK